MKKILSIQQAEIGERIDSLLARKYPEYSRSYFNDLIKRGLITINSKPTKPSSTVKENDSVQIEFIERAITINLLPEKIPLNIVYEDQNVIVINKQPGIPVHPGAGNPSGTIVNALLNYFPKINEAVFEKGNTISEARPGIVHRLDKDTSGIMIIAKNDRAMHSLARQIQNRTVQKTYIALCYGWPQKESGRLINYLGRHPENRKIIADVGKEKGKEAISDYYVEEYYLSDGQKVSLIRFCIHTGRTHQIRVQSKIIGNPVMGDMIYGSKDSVRLSKIMMIKRQLLHAQKLKITLPGDDQPKEFTAPLPEDFAATISKLSPIAHKKSYLTV